MTSKKLIGIERLERLADILVEDILDMSEDEILAEANEQFKNPTAEASQVRNLLQKAILQVSKKKLVKAQLAVKEHKSGERIAQVIQIPTAKRKSVVNRFIKNDPQLHQKLTIAARSGKGVHTDNDIDSMFEDLIELGIINEQEMLE